MKFNHWIFKFWPLSNYAAITLPWGVYFKDPMHLCDASVINHEKIHIQQIEKNGIFKFYSLYVFYYLKNLIKFKNHNLAYLNIPFEVEAYQNENLGRI